NHQKWAIFKEKATPDVLFDENQPSKSPHLSLITAKDNAMKNCLHSKMALDRENGFVHSVKFSQSDSLVVMGELGESVMQNIPLGGRNINIYQISGLTFRMKKNNFITLFNAITSHYSKLEMCSRTVLECSIFISCPVLQHIPGGAVEADFTYSHSMELGINLDVVNLPFVFTTRPGRKIKLPKVATDSVYFVCL
ncbi:hypothetical protein CEXT_578311, partial [Caerostris extrusa]